MRNSKLNLEILILKYDLEKIVNEIIRTQNEKLMDSFVDFKLEEVVLMNSEERDIFQGYGDDVKDIIRLLSTHAETSKRTMDLLKEVVKEAIALYPNYVPEICAAQKQIFSSFTTDKNTKEEPFSTFLH